MPDPVFERKGEGELMGAIDDHHRGRLRARYRTRVYFFQLGDRAGRDVNVLQGCGK
jgi:hypothetical protein